MKANGRGGSVVVPAAFLAAAGLLATVAGADRARAPLAARVEAEAALRDALDLGNDDPAVRGRLIELRRGLGRRPLDAASRATYANLLLALSSHLDDRPAAIFHAELAARQAPVTVPVQRGAAWVLVRCGQGDSAATRVRSMFAFAPRAAARLLARIEPLLWTEQVEAALTDDPEAWLAWTHQLGRMGRLTEADARLDGALERWPGALPVALRASGRAANNEDWETLERVLAPFGDNLPTGVRAAPLWARRARLEAERGNRDAALVDIARALAFSDGHAIRTLAAEVHAALGDDTNARRLAHEALHRIQPGATAQRLRNLIFLARLEERSGTAQRALEHWREVLFLSPEHPEAERRIADLTGGR